MTDQTLRSVSVRRTASGQLIATNQRGVELPLGSAEDRFTPVELLLTAIGGCTALDVEAVTSRRSQPDSFEVQVTADKSRDDSGNHLRDIQVTFRVQFPEGEAGDAARAVLPGIVARSHDRLCTVSRTIERGTPVATRIE